MTGMYHALNIYKNYLVLISTFPQLSVAEVYYRVYALRLHNYIVLIYLYLVILFANFKIKLGLYIKPFVVLSICFKIVFLHAIEIKDISIEKNQSLKKEKGYYLYFIYPKKLLKFHQVRKKINKFYFIYPQKTEISSNQKKINKCYFVYPQKTEISSNKKKINKFYFIYPQKTEISSNYNKIKHILFSLSACMFI